MQLGMELQELKLDLKDFCGHLKNDSVTIDSVRVEADVKALKCRNGLQTFIATARFSSGHLLSEEFQLSIDKAHATFTGKALGLSLPRGSAPGILLTSDVDALISGATKFGFKATLLDVSIFFYGNGTILGLFEGLFPSGKLSNGVGYGSFNLQ